MSFSTWLRDYLYFPLGGSRRGDLRTYRNLMTTMLLGGLWHGASWTFVAWGAVHGVFLCAERWLKSVTRSWSPPLVLKYELLLVLLTFTLVTMTRVFFRSKTLAQAISMLGAMFNPHSSAAAVLPTAQILETALCIVGLLCAHRYMRDRKLETVVTDTPVPVLATAWVSMAFMVILTQGRGNGFIYFQF